MLIKEPRDLNSVFGGLRITSYTQLKQEIIPAIQMLKNSSALKYLEFYRGQGLDSYKLECGLSRLFRDEGKMKLADLNLQKRFLNDIYDGNLSKLEDSIDPSLYPSFEKQWKLNFQAQHLGLKTRLLDWSIDWRIGLLFAVENEMYHNMDGQFWIFYCPIEWRYNDDRRDELFKKDINEIDSPHMVNMAFLLDKGWKEQTGMMRASRQAGRFFVQSYNESTIPMDENKNITPYLIKLIIDGKSKKQIKSDLYDDGPSSEWAYYRTEENVDEAIKRINSEIISEFG